MRGADRRREKGAVRMLLKAWDRLPAELRTAEVRPYYELLRHRGGSLLLKRLFDLLCAGVLLVLLSPVLLILAVWVRTDSAGPVFYRQERVTQYGRHFRIFKFRTMVVNADQIGALVTRDRDPRITRSGQFLRKCRLDELPQLLNILTGDMSLVGTRPEVPRYVARYTDEMRATLLLPAGVTSLASIRYKDEDRLLKDAENVDEVYVTQVLPEKMEYNLDSLRRFSLLEEVKTLFRTVAAVIK